MTSPAAATPASPTEPTQWQPAADTSEPTFAKAARNVALMVAAIRAGKRPGKWLTLSGLPGVGKTMLANQAFAEVRTFARSYAFVKARDFADELYAGNYTIPRMFERMEFVVFDDLGAVRDRSDLIANAVAEFAGVREGKWTLWTTNLTLDQVREIDPRIASRLIRDGNRFVRIEAEDYALRTRKSKEAA